MFPSTYASRGHSKFKFGFEPVKSLTDHPRRYLRNHEESNKHRSSTRQYEGIVSLRVNKALLHITRTSI